MLLELRLSNFRKHKDLIINFTNGLNCIRGSNESGKSSALEAIQYAFFGTAGLEDSLEQVVTYDVPVGQLRVDLAFSLNGVRFDVYRGKSGAELTYGNERITGQTEVTKAIEKLFGTTAKLANKLMFAKQTDLRGVLNEGPTATGQLIEQLADFDLLNDIIEAVQTDLSSGNTAAVEARITMLESASAEELENLVLLQNAAVNADIEVATTKRALEEVKSKIDTAAVETARSELATYKAEQVRKESLEAGLAQAIKTVSAPISECPSEEVLAGLRTAVHRQKEAASLKDLKDRLETANIPPMWEGDFASYEVELEQTAKELEIANAAVNKYTNDIKSRQAKLIKEKTCAFCSKDLSDVPEVVKHNLALDEEILATQLALTGAKENQTEKKNYLTQLQAVGVAHNKAEIIFAACGANILIDRNTVPATAKWVVSIPDSAENAATALKQAEELKNAYLKEMANLKSAETAVDGYHKEIDAWHKRWDSFAPAAHQKVLADHEQLKTLVDLYISDLMEANGKLNTAKNDLQLAESRNKQRTESAAKVKSDLKLAKAEFKEMLENNALIKKLREARPKITDQLWGMVLAAVSTYFSDIRGFASAVTRDAEGFKVNGRPAKGGGLSGSAKDGLGLSIRTSLTKTFVPNTDFMLLDEMAAACDVQREAAMLGMIAKCDFPQVIMVTHSDLCDSYADNMIRIGE